MSEQSMTFLEAIEASISAERNAMDYYADAARDTGNPIGQKLFRQLSEFGKLCEGHVPNCARKGRAVNCRLFG